MKENDRSCTNLSFWNKFITNSIETSFGLYLRVLDIPLYDSLPHKMFHNLVFMAMIAVSTVIALQFIF